MKNKKACSNRTESPAASALNYRFLSGNNDLFASSISSSLITTPFQIPLSFNTRFSDIERIINYTNISISKKW